MIIVLRVYRVRRFYKTMSLLNGCSSVPRTNYPCEPVSRENLTRCVTSQHGQLTVYLQIPTNLSVIRFIGLVGLACQCFIGSVSKLNLISRPENTGMSTENDRYTQKNSQEKCVMSDVQSQYSIHISIIVKNYHSLVYNSCCYYGTKL